jgi:hypothetical protein
MEDEKRIEIWNQELDTAGLGLEVKTEERSIKQGYPMRRGRWEGDGDGRKRKKEEKDEKVE